MSHLSADEDSVLQDVTPKRKNKITEFVGPIYPKTTLFFDMTSATPEQVQGYIDRRQKIFD